MSAGIFDLRPLELALVLACAPTGALAKGFNPSEGIYTGAVAGGLCVVLCLVGWAVFAGDAADGFTLMGRSALAVLSAPLPLFGWFMAAGLVSQLPADRPLRSRVGWLAAGTAIGSAVCAGVAGVMTFQVGIVSILIWPFWLFAVVCAAWYAYSLAENAENETEDEESAPKSEPTNPRAHRRAHGSSSTTDAADAGAAATETRTRSKRKKRTKRMKTRRRHRSTQD